MSEYAALLNKGARPEQLDPLVAKGLIEPPTPVQPKLELVRGRVTPEADFTFIDLFAGIGGLRRGFESIGGRCVFTSEWDKYSQKTYRANFPDDDHDINGDITKIEAADIPAHDVLLAGFPCQPFSIAGVSKKNSLNRPHGFADETQGTLFYDVARIIGHHRPAAFLLENVRNLISHDKGHTYATIKKVLQGLGYTVRDRIVDGRSWVPQHRERIFIVGFLEDSGFDFETMKLPPKSDAPKLGSILHPEDGTEVPDQRFVIDNVGKVNPKYTLTSNLWAYLQNYAAKHKAAGNGFGFGLVGPDDVARTLSARYYKDGSEILIKQGDGAPRRLTPRECARLMGFDEPQGSSFVIPVSDMQAYRQFGNSVVVPAVKAVAEHMKPHILKAVRRQMRKAAIG